MAKIFKFEVITPERVIYTDSVLGIIADGTEGSLGILADHAPLITGLKRGYLTVNEVNNKALRFILDGGFLEVLNNTAVVLTERCVTESEVERARANNENIESYAWVP
ncbi:MAG: ATP synthase F1 subunit epsilon [Planctomycetia bacterium]|nr:ATP synthase F1 subunit epsilon [Candidatus Brocadia sp.]QOJ06576.1 MAG: ATP synthase F1 subunit epsilon [Planctomycetia bacterium]TVL95068.1 MAG: ATP synthase F1 subunit epsilon [Candidatus Brocadia sp. BL1]HQU31946.1 ATP synthase F1 subunit epsilon [Candidatus Brocadia sapporoensis]